MASYADYTYYTGTFHGSTIASTEFANLAIRASAAIDQATFGRAASVIAADDPAETVTAIRMATCAVADDLKGFETAQDGITSDPAVSIGDVIEVAEFSSSKAVAVGYVTVTADVIG